jgi:hypothetical protein
MWLLSFPFPCKGGFSCGFCLTFPVVGFSFVNLNFFNLRILKTRPNRINQAMRPTNERTKLPLGDWVHGRHDTNRFSPPNDVEQLHTVERRTSEIDRYQTPRRHYQLGLTEHHPNRHDDNMELGPCYLPTRYEETASSSSNSGLVLYQAPASNEHRSKPTKRGIPKTDKYRPAYAGRYSTIHRYDNESNEGRTRISLNYNSYDKKQHGGQDNGMISSSSKPVGYTSLDNFIARKALAKGISTLEYHLVRERMMREVRNRYNPAECNPCWRLWCAESKIFHHYCKLILRQFMKLLLILCSRIRVLSRRGTPMSP